jgi:hypothetical protein
MTHARNKKFQFFGACVICAVVLFLALVSNADAYKTEFIPDPDNVVGDFVVGPGRIELEIKPGEEKVTNIIVTNRMGDTREFRLEIEDTAGSNDPKEAVVLLGSDRGPYSLKDYISYDESSFVLRQGERATIPVTIRVPEDAEPGGLYGSVLTTTHSLPVEQGGLGEDETQGGMAIVSRIGTLFFVTVPGDIEKEGALTGFSTIPDKAVFQSGPIRFQLPWYSMPQSSRFKEVVWDRPYLFGYYEAQARINPGYGEEFEEITVSFWVLPWKMVAAGFAGLILVIFILRFIGRNFKIERKKSE